MPYLISTIFFGTGLTAVFVLRQRTKRTVSIRGSYTHRRKMFYWAAVLFAVVMTANQLE